MEECGGWGDDNACIRYCFYEGELSRRCGAVSARYRSVHCRLVLSFGVKVVRCHPRYSCSSRGSDGVVKRVHLSDSISLFIILNGEGKEVGGGRGGAG